MNEQPLQPRNFSIPINVPVAIIVAGALIAAGVYFKPGGGEPAPLRQGSAG